MVSLLNTIRDTMKKVPILGLGDDACNLLKQMDDMSVNVEWAYNLDHLASEPKSVIDSISNPFLLLNEKLTSMGSEPISW